MFVRTFLGGGARITILEFTLDKCLFKLLRDFAVEEIISYESLNARKEEKLSTDELPTRGG
jgi:hypothetical protein